MKNLFGKAGMPHPNTFEVGFMNVAFGIFCLKLKSVISEINEPSK